MIADSPCRSKRHSMSWDQPIDEAHRKGDNLSANPLCFSINFLSSLHLEDLLLISMWEGADFIFQTAQNAARSCLVRPIRSAVSEVECYSSDITSQPQGKNAALADLILTGHLLPGQGDRSATFHKPWRLVLHRR